MKLEPIYTIADLKACKPSDLLEKAVEAYPDIVYHWEIGTRQAFENGACCPAALLFGAAGVDRFWSDSDGKRVGSPPALTYGSDSLGVGLSYFSIRCKSFKEVINKLREIGC